MNLVTEHLNAINFWLGVMVLYFFLYWIWPRLIVDIARYKLFVIRDKVFLLGAEKKLDFNSQDYQKIRASINNMIRFCHTFTWVNLTIVNHMELSEEDKKEEVDSLYKTINKIDDLEVRNVLNGYITNLYFTIILLIFLRSPLLIILTPFVIMQAILSNKTTGFTLENLIKRDISIENRIAKFAYI